MTQVTSDSVLRILTEEDVEGLLAVGAPPDEYDSEAAMIAQAVIRLGDAATTENAVLEVVTEVCTRMFGPFDAEQVRQRRDTYVRIARRIFSLRA